MYLAALGLGRQASALPALALAAGIMVGLEPGLLWDLSFQLSFTAMAGLILLGPPLGRWALALTYRLAARREVLLQPLAAVAVATSVSVAAVVATLPLIAFNFHQLPLLGVPATLLALPALPGILATGFVTGALGVISPAVAQGVAWLPWALEWYLVEVVGLFASIPGGTVQVGAMAPVLVGAYYLILVGVLFLGRHAIWLPATREAARRLFTPPSRRSWRVGVLLAAALATALIWSAALAQPDGRLHAYFLDVGQGDAILIRTPAGYNILVDGGPDPTLTLPALDGRLPFWDRDMDLAVLTHPDADHLTGLVALAQRGRLQRVLESPPKDEASSLYTLWELALEARQVPRLEAVVGQVIQTPDGVHIEVVNPPSPPMTGTSGDRNNNAIVLRLVYGRFSALLTSDIHGEGELSLLDRGAQVDVTMLKVAHHGSETSTRRQFLEAVTPEVAIISFGHDNPFGHPALATLQVLQEYLPMDRLFLTAEDGTIEVVTDGTAVWVEQER